MGFRRWRRFPIIIIQGMIESLSVKEFHKEIWRIQWRKRGLECLQGVEIALD